jgi:hypothetical protein
MQFKFLATIITLVTLTVAAPDSPTAGSDSGSAEVQCCGIYKASTPLFNNILSTFGVSGPPDGDLGLGCTVGLMLRYSGTCCLVHCFTVSHCYR